MKITITKQADNDRIALHRDDGSTAETTFPKKGVVPHDAVHFFVEQAFGLRRGFWGMVAEGRHPEDIAALAKAAGHASAKRASLPEPEIIELLQAERLVECFEADMWSPGSEEALLLDVARTGCEASHVELPAIAEGAVEMVRSRLTDFARGWVQAPPGHVATLEWE